MRDDKQIAAHIADLERRLAWNEGMRRAWFKAVIFGLELRQMEKTKKTWRQTKLDIEVAKLWNAA